MSKDKERGWLDNVEVPCARLRDVLREAEDDGIKLSDIKTVVTEYHRLLDCPDLINNPTLEAVEDALDLLRSLNVKDVAVKGNDLCPLINDLLQSRGISQEIMVMDLVPRAETFLAHCEKGGDRLEVISEFFKIFKSYISNNEGDLLVWRVAPYCEERLDGFFVVRARARLVNSNEDWKER